MATLKLNTPSTRVAAVRPLTARRWLQSAFPAVFDARDPKPLIIGAMKELRPVAPGVD